MSEIIRTLQPGEKITEPGFYNIPLHQHHSQPCEGVSVTSGVLRTMELESPAQVWAHHQLNPDHRPKLQTKAMIIGGAMAALIAGGVKELQRQFRILKDDVPRYPKEETWAAYREKRVSQANSILACKVWSEIDADPRPKLRMYDVALLRDMAKVLVADPAAQFAMSGLPEVTMAAWDEENKLWLLSRPDTVNPDARLTSDYKKMATRGDPFTEKVVSDAIERNGYGMQMAFSNDVYQRITGDWLEDVCIVGQWETYPHHVIPRPIEEDVIIQDMFRTRRSARRFRECLDSGVWPGPGSEVRPHKRPQWKYEMFENQMREEGFEA